MSSVNRASSVGEFGALSQDPRGMTKVEARSGKVLREPRIPLLDRRTVRDSSSCERATAERELVLRQNKVSHVTLVCYSLHAETTFIHFLYWYQCQYNISKSGWWAHEAVLVAKHFASKPPCPTGTTRFLSYSSCRCTTKLSI